MHKKKKELIILNYNIFIIIILIEIVFLIYFENIRNSGICLLLYKSKIKYFNYKKVE